MQCGMTHFWRDFSEWCENKCALVHGRVGQREFGGGEDDVAVEQQVEIDDARAFGWSISL